MLSVNKSGKPCSSFDSLDAAEAEEAVNGPSTSMDLILKFSHMQAANTHTQTRTSLPIYLVVYLCLFLSAPAGPMSVYNLTPSFHQHPLWAHNVFTSHHFTTHTNWCCWLAHWLVFVTLLLWHLTFSRSFPKCQLIIFTPCTLSPLSPFYFPRCHSSMSPSALLVLFFFK